MSDDRLPWFHCYPSKLLGALAAMGADEQLVFMTTILRIYETRGPIADDERALARRTALTPRRVAAAMARLFALGKLVKHGGAGAYTNPVAQEEIEAAETTTKTVSAKNSENAKKRWQKPEQNQQVSDAVGMRSHGGRNASAMRSDADKDRETDYPDSSSLRSEESGVVPSGEGTGRRRKGKNAYTADFEEFWSGYPTDANMSKVEAFDNWKTIEPAERALAIKSLPAFRAYCKAHPDYRPVHACRYLKKKRFEGHAQSAAAGAAPAASVYIVVNSPQWQAWLNHHRQRNGPGDHFVIDQMESFAKTGEAFPRPTEWPPGYESLSEAA